MEKISNAGLLEQLIKNGNTDPDSKEFVFLPPMPRWENGNKRFEDYNWLDLDNVFIFGRYGSNAFYCWKNDTDEVYYCDEVGVGTAEYFAPDLASAFFRIVLEFASGDYCEFSTDESLAEMDEDEADEFVSESEAADMLRQYLSVFGKYWETDRCEMIEAMIKNGLVCSDAYIYPDEAYKKFTEQFPQECIGAVLDLQK